MIAAVLTTYTCFCDACLYLHLIGIIKKLLLFSVFFLPTPDVDIGQRRDRGLRGDAPGGAFHRGRGRQIWSQVRDLREPGRLARA